MRLAIALGLLLVTPAFSAPTAVPITKRAVPVKLNSYIISFKDGASKTTFLSALSHGFTQSGSGVTHEYTIIDAVAATVMPGAEMDFVRGFQNVQSIEPDSIMSINYELGLDGFEETTSKRSSTMSRTLDKRTNGQGVDIYGIDTGIYINHSCFGGRAKWGATYGGYADMDGNGHGTHTAGTAVGTTYGVATGANVIAVKVLSDAGSGATSDVISGVEYATNSSKASGKPSIATMSLGGTVSMALDKAVQTAIDGGLHVTAAAGNSYTLAETSSPADVKAANTIGAVDSNNQKASFSNWGELIDVWAPGVNTLSAWIGSPNATNTLSGTSMATPYVAGVLAVALGKYGQMTPDSLSQMLKDHAEPVVTFSPADTPAKLISTNKLAKKW